MKNISKIKFQILADSFPFRGQSVPRLYQMLDEAIARLFPNRKTLHYVKPIKIDRDQTPLALDTYAQLLQQGKT